MFFLFLLVGVAFTTLVERKIMASIQRRKGPNVVGILGILQPIADGLKLFLKEIVYPSQSNSLFFFFAPLFTFFCSILLWFIVPFSFSSVLNEIPFSILYVMGISSISVYAIIFSGWSSNSKYAFYGSLRSAAQMISYEVSISFVFILMILLSQSFEIEDVVSSQCDIWYLFPLFPVWFIFFVSVLAETNRAPFDLPEAEGELVAGYFVEYSSIIFALFFLGEYSNILFMSTLLSLFFLGGWLNITGEEFHVFFNCLSLGIKVIFHVFIFCWVRASLPRYRYDQLMNLGWKVLMPLNVVFVLYSGYFFFLLNVISFSY